MSFTQPQNRVRNKTKPGGFYKTLKKAEKASINCQFFIVLGSSLKVSPANNFVRIAKNNGAKIIILNKDPTPMDGYADIVINECLENIYEQIK